MWVVVSARVAASTSAAASAPVGALAWPSERGFVHLLYQLGRELATTWSTLAMELTRVVSSNSVAASATVGALAWPSERVFVHQVGCEHATIWSTLAMGLKWVTSTRVAASVAASASGAGWSSEEVFGQRMDMDLAAT
jgi:hypothetical protein